MIWFILMSVVCVLVCSSSYLVSFISGVMWQGLEMSMNMGLMEEVFMGVVSIIVFHALVLVYLYMSEEHYLSGFISVMMLFVASMLVFISSSSLGALLLGWDGLGASSLFLVIWYQSWNSFDSGMTTFLSNRLGDLLLILSLIMLLSVGSVSYSFSISSCMSSLILIACFTKSAQIPLSVWLPMAMSAPTPVSALVHSSTLVTAGMLLALKVESVLCSELLAILGVCTMVVTGWISVFEMDLKKIVALSTLSQLGFMGLGVGMGLLSLVFFHMMTHAFIKSALLIVVGIILHNSLGTQDKRLLSLSGIQQSYCLSVMIICSMALCGLGFTSGSVSKEFILLYSLSWVSQMCLMMGLIMGVAFTFIYCSRLISISSQMQSQSLMMMYWSFKTISSSLGLVIMSIILGWGLSESLFFVSPFISSWEKMMMYVFLVVAWVLWVSIEVRGLVMSMMGCHFLYKCFTKWYMSMVSVDRVYIDRLNWTCLWWVEWLILSLWDNKEKSFYLITYVMVSVFILF